MHTPDFFIVGAPRCGTTSLYEYLRQHPEIFMSPSKELHFFGADIRNSQAAKMVKDKEEYLSMFSGVRDEKRVGEASPFYLYSKLAARDIEEFCPTADIIIMLRNPVDMMYSMFVERRFYAGFNPGQETIEVFADALEAEEDRKAGRRISQDTATDGPGPFHLFYRDIARYPDQVSRYMSVFRRDHIHFVIFDDLASDSPRAYREVCDFLGVDTSFQPDFAIQNANKRMRSRMISRFYLSPQPWVLRLGRLFVPRPLRPSINRMLSWMAGTPSKPTPIDPELRARLLAEFEPEIRQLSEIVGRDLTPWARGEPVTSEACAEDQFAHRDS